MGSGERVKFCINPLLGFCLAKSKKGVFLLFIIYIAIVPEGFPYFIGICTGINVANFEASGSYEDKISC